MKNVPLLIFDDNRGDLGPLTDLRPAFALRNGSRTNRERIEDYFEQSAVALLVPDQLTATQAERETRAVINPTTLDHPRSTLFINGRWTGHNMDVAEQICALMAGEALRTPSGDLLAWCVAADDLNNALSGQLSDFTPPDHAFVSESAVMLSRPWHLLDHLEATLRHDLQHSRLPQVGRAKLGQQGVTVVGEHPVLVHPDAILFPHVVINTTQGPVALDAGVTVQPFTVIEGPAYIGPNSELAAHTALRSCTVVGSDCKVGGEVKASVLGDYTNKAHHGYLGNAVVGQWCNLGAGTTASNLKNTYGQVRMQLHADEKPQDTGRQFQGPVIGDYVRAAVSTTLPTGACIGTGSCVVSSGFAPKHVPPMTFLTDAGPEPMDTDAFFSTADRMMCRRNGTLTDAQKQRFQSLR